MKYIRLSRTALQTAFCLFVCRLFRWPYLCVANVMLTLDLLDLRRTLDVCLSGVSPEVDNIPDVFVDVLIAAEDHRNHAHFGVDPVAIIRSLLASAAGNRQGGSTIEQQFVRITLASYDQTLLRKLKEQALATLLSRRANRRTIAKNYLSKAYYGTGLNSLLALQRRYGLNLPDMCVDKVIEVVARLKYPEPRNPSIIWQAKFLRRCSWLRAHLEFKEGLNKPSSRRKLGSSASTTP